MSSTRKMILVDETVPVGEVKPSFPPKDVIIRRGIKFEDEYLIQSEIGRGKFGTVYRCQERNGGLSLAAKLVDSRRKDDRRSVQREVEIMRMLQHHLIIQLYDAIDANNKFYMILELIEGGELFERVIDDDFVLTERSCAIFMKQICEGVEFLHSKYILHLDMKPENILCLTKEGNRIKIIDFGLARQYDPAKKLQVLFGTPEFVAPEVLNFDAISFGTDMWSVGVICYVLLSGLSPFMGDTDLETMGNVTLLKYDFEHDVFAKISQGAKNFVKSLLIKDCEKRATASECLQHEWLVKTINTCKTSENSGKPSNGNLESEKRTLDLTKDRLRLFVERWREHPNSPYKIYSEDETKSCLTFENEEKSSSVRAQSPSNRSSTLSSGAESPKTNEALNGGALDASSLDFSLGRRSSDSATPERHRNAATRIFLAEEILKLSEHLRSLAVHPFASDKKVPGDSSKPPLVKKRKKPPSKATKQTAAGEIGENATGCPCRSEDAVESTGTNSPRYLNEPTSAKNRLLHLLGKWEDVQRPTEGKRKSISTDWCAEKLVTRNSLNSLAAYFRSRHEKSAPSQDPSTSQSVQR